MDPNELMSQEPLMSEATQELPPELLPVNEPVLPVEAPEPPPLPIGPSGLLNLKAPDGTPVTAAPEHMDSLLADGYTLATDDDILAQLQAEEYGDLGSQVATGLESAAQGATLGAYGLVTDALAGPEYTEERLLREQYNPGTAIAGNIAGAVAPALLSGGTGALATAARLTPAAKLAQLGTKMGTYLTEKAGTSVLGKIAATGFATGVEGALDNATRTVLDDMSRGDVDITAERMVEAAWDGFKYSALLGTGVGAIGEGASALAKRGTTRALEASEELTQASTQLDDAVATGRPLEAVELELDEAYKALAETDSLGDPTLTSDAEARVAALSAEHEAVVARDMGLTTDSQIELRLKVEDPEQAKGIWNSIKQNLGKVRNAKDLENKFDDAVEGTIRSVTDDLDNLQRLQQNTLDPIFNKSNKPKAIAAALNSDDGGIQWTSVHSDRLLSENRKSKEALEQMYTDYFGGDDLAKKKLPIVRNAIEALEGQYKVLTGLSGQGPISPESTIMRGTLEDIQRLYWGEDQIKTYFGRLARKKGEIVSPSEAALQRLYMTKRGSLQDKRIWGNRLTQMQTATNAAETQYIPASRVFNNKFGVSKSELAEHAGEHGFEELLERDPKKLSSFLRDLGAADSYKDELDFSRGILRQIELAEVKAKFYPTTPEKLAQIVEARKTAEGIVNKVKELKVLNVQKMAAQKLAREHNSLEGIYSLLDLAAGFVPGASLAGRIAKPIIQGLAPSTGNLASGAVKAERGVNKAVSASYKFVTEGMQKRPTGLGITTNAVRRAFEEAEALQDPSSPESQALKTQLQDIANDSPELASAIESKTLQKAEFLLSKRGPVLDNSDPLGIPKAVIQNKQAVVRTARYVDAARNPEAALQRIANGYGYAEDIETLKALYPAMYNSFGKRAVAKAASSKKPLTIRQRQALHRTTGLPTLREHEPRSFQFLQGVAQASSQPKEQPEPGAAPSNKPVDPDALMARSDAFMTNE